MNTGFVGIGSMGGMLVRRLLRSGALAVENTWVANRSSGKVEALVAEFPGIQIASVRKLAAHCDLIFLCIKAGDVASVLAQMDPELYPGQLLVTTASQIPLQALENRVPCRVAKVIPSVTQEINTGIALLMYGSRTFADDHKLLDELLGGISHLIEIAESQSRPAIGLTSGGPAFVAYLLKSMAEEAARSNPDFPPELALKLVHETATATLRLMAERKMTPEEVIRRVALPGGMTAIGINALARHVPQAWQAVFVESAEREKSARETLVL